MRFLVSMVVWCAAALIAAPFASSLPQSSSDTVELLHRPLDQILDTLVRDGLVYYHALKTERGRLDRYVGSLNVPSSVYEKWTREQQIAFWVNAYNAFVLETVINHYPIHGRSSLYPAVSIRQIPGAFEQTTWRAAGRTVTLDQIEKTILPEFRDPRLYLALGRGAVGSGRLRSEAYTGERLPQQLAAIQSEFVTNPQMLRIDRLASQVATTAILSWHEQEFVAAYEKAADPLFAQRSPIERALLAFIAPALFPLEKELIRQNQFKVTFLDFDWQLNDLTGR
jgi:Protein of unknown function, DUF547